LEGGRGRGDGGPGCRGGPAARGPTRRRLAGGGRCTAAGEQEQGRHGTGDRRPSPGGWSVEEHAPHCPRTTSTVSEGRGPGVGSGHGSLLPVDPVRPPGGGGRGGRVIRPHRVDRPGGRGG